MVIDSSALVAVVRNESEGARFQRVIESASSRLVSAATLAETSIVMLSRFGEGGVTDLEAFLEAAGIDVVPFTAEHAARALDAFRRFGKGRSPAGLNLGDCFSYALAQASGQPLLFKGEDFARTDLEAA